MPRNPATDAFVAKLPAATRATGERLTRIARRGLPGAAEAIRWRTPFWFVDGQPVVFLMVFDRMIHLGFADGATLEDPDGILEGTGKFFRHVKMERGASDALLLKYVKLARKQALAFAKASPPPAARAPAAKRAAARKPAKRSTRAS